MLHIIEQDTEEIRILFHLGKPQLLAVVYLIEDWLAWIYCNFTDLLPSFNSFFLVKCNALKFQMGLLQTENFVNAAETYRARCFGVKKMRNGGNENGSIFPT